jgi:hypothetical protein
MPDYHLSGVDMANGGKKGWRRIGIVLSVLWFIGFGGFLWTNGVGHISEFHRGQLEGCYRILNADNESLQYIQKSEDRDKRQSANWTKYQRCQTEAGNFFQHEFDEQKRAIPLLIAIDLGAALLGWILVWFIVLIRRWIKRGFTSA